MQIRRHCLGWVLPMACLALGLYHTRGAGVTLVTHGLNGNVDEWVIPMGERIPAYPGFAGSGFTCYEIYFQSAGSSFAVAQNRIGGDPPESTSSGEIFVKLDWRQLANNSFSTYQVAAMVAPRLLDPGFIPELNGRALAALPLHMAGHSRGGSLICELSRLLGEQGLWIDHLTTLDPHPLNNDGFSDWPYTVVDATAAVYENVLFADNYFQTLNFFAYGKAMTGAYNRQLTNLDGGYGGLTAAHSDAHLWYHGTLDLNTPATDSGATITSSERAGWWTAFETRGTNAGFRYSRIGGGNRFSAAEPAGAGRGRIRDGMNQRWDFGAGLANNRTTLGTHAGLWPNLIQLNLAGSNRVQLGQQVSVDYDYQFGPNTAGEVELQLYLDPDPNPWNGNEILAAQTTQPGTGPGAVNSGPLHFAAAAPAQPGDYYVIGKITANSRSRWLQAPERLTLLPGLEPPQLTALGWVDLSFVVEVNGSAGQTIVLEASEDFSHWTPLATNTLGHGPWAYGDAAAGALARRFYRAVGTDAPGK